MSQNEDTTSTCQQEKSRPRSNVDTSSASQTSTISCLSNIQTHIDLTISQADRNGLEKSGVLPKTHVKPHPYFATLYSRLSFSLIVENKNSAARDHLANERTFLAWLRTSLSLFTAGIAVTQVYNLSPSAPSKDGAEERARIGRGVGLAFFLLSILFLYFANVRYFHSQHTMNMGYFPASRGCVILSSLGLLFSLTAALIVILLKY
ncbi:hypothetical protein F4703DRAFT_1798993 [Phycomyces blakesleeanus]